MSAFAGMINLDASPADSTYLEKMASYLSRIGPDDQKVWTGGQAGMVHALLKTTASSIHSQQPFVMDQYVIVGDVRIDGRNTFLKALAAKGVYGLENKQDIEIVLHGWLLWKQKLTDHLLGDFSLAIWDSAEKRLFGLRDHMGVRPFFYALVGDLLIFSNVLNCLSMFPVISEELNDQAVVDFLVFGYNLEFDTTIFKSIQQLAPAHFIDVTPSKKRIERYWDMPVDELLRYRNSNDYVEHFKELFDASVNNRISNANIGALISGGLDSTSVAATVHKLLKEAHRQDRLKLFSLDIQEFWPEDEELKYAQAVAEKLNVGLIQQSAKNLDIFSNSDTGGWFLPEPSKEVFRQSLLSILKKMAAFCPVGFTGHGGDSTMLASPGYINRQIRKGNISHALTDAFNYILRFKKRPQLSIKSSLKKKLEKSPLRPIWPPWLSSTIMEQTGFSERYYRHTDSMVSFDTSIHPVRPEAFTDLSSSMWPAVFQDLDSQTTGLPIEFRHPFFDIRLIRFLLRVPPIPWFHNKELLRSSMLELLPDTVRTREKTFPRRAPSYEAITRQSQSSITRKLEDIDILGKYINIDCYAKMLNNIAQLKSNEVTAVSLPLSLVQWLKYR